MNSCLFRQVFYDFLKLKIYVFNFEGLRAKFPKFWTQYLNLDTFSYKFCFLVKKIWGDPKKDMSPTRFRTLKATIIFSLAWGISALGTKKYLHVPSKWVIPNENWTKIDWIRAKNKMSYFQGFEGSKKAGFWPKTLLFLTCWGTPWWVSMIFEKKWPPPKNVLFQDRILTQVQN